MAREGKERIIEATKRVISIHGINGATMRYIAVEAGLSTGAIYHYYNSKEEILYDVMDESLSESTRIAEEAKIVEPSKKVLLAEINENILKRFNKFDENRIQFYLAEEAMLGNEELIAKFKDKYSEWINRTEELIKDLYGKEQTRLNKAFASLLIGAIDGVVIQMLLGANKAKMEDIAEVYSLILSEGIPKFQDYLSKIDKK
jgi:AcrR family transcriptional regulator